MRSNTGYIYWPFYYLLKKLIVGTSNDPISPKKPFENKLPIRIGIHTDHFRCCCCCCCCWMYLTKRVLRHLFRARTPFDDNGDDDDDDHRLPVQDWPYPRAPKSAIRIGNDSLLLFVIKNNCKLISISVSHIAFRSRIGNENIHKSRLKHYAIFQAEIGKNSNRSTNKENFRNRSSRRRFEF